MTFNSFPVASSYEAWGPGHAQEEDFQFFPSCFTMYAASMNEAGVGATSAFNSFPVASFAQEVDMLTEAEMQLSILSQLLPST